MATVPQYGQQQVEQRALPGARQSSVASPSLFSAGADATVATGKSLMQAGTALNDVAIRMQERENADMLFRSETALKDEYLKFEQSIRSRKGQNAWGALSDTEKWFTDQEKQHSETLGNDKQRYLFKQSITKMRQSAMGSVAQYEDGERKRSLDESARASIVGSINMAAAQAAEGLIVASGENAGGAKVTKNADGVEEVSAPGVTVGRNPIPGIKKDIINRVQVLADINGWSPERKTAEEAQHLTNLHKQVIQSMVDRNPTAASRYFEANKAEINGSEQDTIKRVLNVGEVRQAGFDFANRDDIRKLETEEGQIIAARDFFADEPLKREAAIGEIKTRWNERRQFREAGQKDAADAAWKIYSQTGSLSSVPASVIATMDGRDVENMRTHAQNKAAGVSVKTDPSTYYDLRRIAADDPGTFRAIDLRKFVNRLSPSDFQEFVKLQTNDNDRTDAATLSQQLSNTHDLMKWGTGDKAKKGGFDKAVTDAINTEQQRTGKKLNYSERQALIDKMLIEGEVDGSGYFSDKKTFYEVAGKPEAAKFEPKISPADKQAIVDRFTQKNGKAPTPAEINAIYKTWKGL